MEVNILWYAWKYKKVTGNIKPLLQDIKSIISCLVSILLCKLYKLHLQFKYVITSNSTESTLTANFDFSCNTYISLNHVLFPWSQIPIYLDKKKKINLLIYIRILFHLHVSIYQMYLILILTRIFQKH